MGDVHIKVSIARKQPMLDAATGKSVWASIGKVAVGFMCVHGLNQRSSLSIFYSSCAEQHQRLLQRQEEPSCVQRRLPWRKLVFVFCYKLYSILLDIKSPHITCSVCDVLAALVIKLLQ